MKVGEEVKAVVAEEDKGSFCIQLQAMEFMAEQKRIRVRNDEKR